MTKISSVLSPATSKPASSESSWPEREILAWIRALTDEKDGLRRGHQGRPQPVDDATRLREIESVLDRSWDLVRQRRARRAAGQNWDDLTQRVVDLVAACGH